MHRRRFSLLGLFVFLLYNTSPIGFLFDQKLLGINLVLLTGCQTLSLRGWLSKTKGLVLTICWASATGYKLMMFIKSNYRMKGTF